jgi:hypothetical protein
MLRTLFQCCEHLFPCCEHLFPCCEYIFPCCEHFFHVAPPPSSPGIVYMLRVMLRVCGEHVASLWQACCDQHPNLMLRTLFPCCEQLFPCCEHFSHVAPPPSSPDIVYILQAMLRACGEHVASMLRSLSKHQMQGCGRLGGRPIFSPVGRLIRSITDIIMHRLFNNSAHSSFFLPKTTWSRNAHVWIYSRWFSPSPFIVLSK